MAKIDNLHLWLSSIVSVSADRKYKHQLLTEDASRFSDVENGMKGYFADAHNDAKRHYSNLIAIDLSPGALIPSANEALTNYPEGLPIAILQSYFGEIFAGLVAEHLAPFDEGEWKVPAFLMRFHNVVFEQLEKSHRAGQELPLTLPGRTGDDCLAFIKNESGQISKVLFCESKCVQGHRAEYLNDAHEKLSGVFNCVHQIIEILEGRSDVESLSWIEPLRQLRMKKEGTDFEQCNLLCYISGDMPVRRTTWIPVDVAHEKYTASRRLEAVELHLANLLDIVRKTYNAS